MSAPVGGHVGIARAYVLMSRSPRRHTIASVAASIACPYAHLMPRCLAAPVVAFGLAVCKFGESSL